MEFNSRATDRKASNQAPGYNNFPEQALRAGSYAGRFHHECFPDHPHPHPHPHPQPQPQPQPHPYPHPHPHPHHHLLLQPHDLHEALQREIEKQHIREEIIISEIARRRVLEAEVRRELMMERELALRRGENGFPFGPSLGTGYDSTIRLPLLGMRSEERCLEERAAMQHKEEWQNGRHDILPFQRCTAEPRISEVKPVSEGGKVKEKVVLLAKPHENITGEKRKDAMLSVVDDVEHPSAAVSRKKAKEEWSCALCQVSATSEQALKDHVQGKKHKSKEAALRAQRAGKNYTIGFFPKKAALPVTVVGTKTLGSEEGVKSATQSLHLSKMGETSSKKKNTPLLQERRKLDNIKSKQSEGQEMGKDGNSKKNIYKFWCEMCQVGACSRKVMNAHTKGKKHVKRLQLLCNQNGAAPSCLNKKDKVRVNDGEGVAGDGIGKNTTEENVGAAVDAVSSEDNKTVDAANAEDHNAVETAKPEGNGSVAVAKADCIENNEAVELEYDEDMDASKPEHNEDNDPVEPEYTEAINAPELDVDQANDADQPEYKEAMDATKPVDCEVDDVVEPGFSEVSIAAQPDDYDANDGVKTETIEAMDTDKPDVNEADGEVEQ